MSDPNVIITDYKLTHNSPEDIGLSPIIWEVNASVNNLMESAGENYLIKIGETIGEQSQLYQTSTRQLPVAVDVLRNYHRRIELLIPDGYHIDDISSLNMNVTMMDHDKVSCFFRSDASLKGNLLIITSEEKYTETYYPKEKFEEFRSVINAAADFNKKTILLSRN